MSTHKNEDESKGIKSIFFEDDEVLAIELKSEKNNKEVLTWHYSLSKEKYKMHFINYIFEN